MVQESPAPVMLGYAAAPIIRPQRPWWLSAIFECMWLALGVAVVVIISAVAVVLSLGCWPVAPAILVFLLVGWHTFSRRVRRQRARVILTYLEQAVRLNLPLPAMLSAGARSESWPIGRALERLRNMLASGYSLGQSAQIAMPDLPSWYIRRIEVAERLGQLRQVLRELVAEDRQEAAKRLEVSVFYRTYLLTLPVIMCAIAVAWMIWLVPQFGKIFSDFHASLPKVTVSLISLADWVGINWWLFVVAGGVIVLAFVTGEARQLLTGWTPRRTRQWVLGDRVRWAIPITRTLDESHGLAELCQLLAATCAAGTDLPIALREAMQVEMNSVLQARVAAWEQGLERGQGVAEAAAQARLPDLMVGLLKTGTATASTPEVLSFLARYYRSRFSRTAVMLRSAAGPIAVLLLGGLVGYVVLAFFLPLVQLINTVADFKEGVL